MPQWQYSPGTALQDMQLIANGGGHSWATGIIAKPGTPYDAQPLMCALNFIDTVTTGSGVSLPRAMGGQMMYLFNRTANDVAVYAAPGTNDVITVAGTPVASETLTAGTSQILLSTLGQWTEMPAGSLTGVSGVSSFNGRQGAVTLGTSDITSAGGLPTSGGTMTGPLTLSGNATGNLQPATLQQLSVVNVLDHGAKGDGATDDTTAIQNTLNSFAGKAIVLIPNTGSAFMVNGLYPPSNTDLIINGTLKLRPSQTAAPVNLSSVNNVYIHGFGVIDGNGAAQTATIASVYVYQANYLVFEGVTIQNAKAWNLNVVASNHVRVNRVYLLGGVNANEFAQACDDCEITHSLIDGVSNDGGFVFYGGVTNSRIIGCIVRNLPVATGIAVYNDAAQLAACSHITIANNICYNIGDGGISVNRDTTATAIHTNIIIIGNRCYANNTAKVQYADIWVSTGAAVVVSGNLLGGSGSSTVPFWGVFVGNNSAMVSVTGNTIYDEGQGGTAGSGIYIQAAPDVLVSGNVIGDNQATKSMQSAISGNAGPRNVIGANEFGQFIGAANQLVMAADTIVLTGSLVVPGVTSINAPIIISSSGTVSNSYELKAAGNGTDQNIWDWLEVGTSINFRAVNDAATAANTWLQATRSGYTVSDITATANTLHTNATVYATSGRVVSENAANSPALAMWDTTNSHGYALHIDTSGNLFFGTSDANGNPVTNYAYMDPGGNLVLTNGSVLATSGEISVGAPGLVVAGNNVVGSRISGWGTPTGGARTANFPGASATLAQTSAVVAQLILDLKTHGLLGA